MMHLLGARRDSRKQEKIPTTVRENLQNNDNFLMFDNFLNLNFLMAQANLVVNFVNIHEFQLSNRKSRKIEAKFFESGLEIA